MAVATVTAGVSETAQTSPGGRVTHCTTTVGNGNGEPVILHATIPRRQTGSRTIHTQKKNLLFVFTTSDYYKPTGLLLLLLLFPRPPRPVCKFVNFVKGSPPPRGSDREHFACKTNRFPPRTPRIAYTHTRGILTQTTRYRIYKGHEIIIAFVVFFFSHFPRTVHSTRKTLIFDASFCTL